MSELLAKSARRGLPAKTLLQHTLDVVESVDMLFGDERSQTRLGDAWCRFFQLPECAPFRKTTLAAAAFHDIGKANDSFQSAVLHGARQALRHEFLSALILALPEFEMWLNRRSDVDWEIVIAAVASHHLKTQRESFGCKIKSSDAAAVRLASVDEFRALLAAIAERLGLPQAALPNVPSTWSFGPGRGIDIFEHARTVQSRLDELDDILWEDEARFRLLRAVRAALIAADALGSAVDRLGTMPRQWIETAFDPGRLCTGDKIRGEVIEPRVAELRKRGRWHDDNGRDGWNTFQLECAERPARTLLLAPCGSGKTLAAWRWIATQLDRRPAARVIFLYPTRATATEGFRDYVSWAPEDAALVHATSSYDLDGMFENPQDPGDARRDRDYQTERSLFALGLWERRIFAATIDQFLAFMQYQYGPVCLLPLLADSVIVVDEIHSFDRSMFRALKQFLQNFPAVPVLCMTATLPATRREQLANECGMTIYDEKPDDLCEVANLERYSVDRIPADSVRARVEAALLSGKRVLWVVNNVRRCQELPLAILRRFPDAERLELVPEVPLYCYHSRFKLKDRKDRHGEVVAAFQGTGGAALALTTQVCEMSLDLDADMLVTEVAPVTALIQRMGRCVREPRPKSGRIGEVLIYTPPDALPYDTEMLAGSEQFVDELVRAGRVSQARLEDALERRGPRIREPHKACSFIESGPYAMAHEQSFREGLDFTAESVLDEDVGGFLAASPTEKMAFTVPVPHRFAKATDARLPSYLRVAAASHYHPRVGFCDVSVF
jgi:CRISPR-associated endonuclease/helicase Cas3